MQSKHLLRSMRREYSVMFAEERTDETQMQRLSDLLSTFHKSHGEEESTSLLSIMESHLHDVRTKLERPRLPQDAILESIHAPEVEPEGQLSFRAHNGLHEPHPDTL